MKKGHQGDVQFAYIEKLPKGAKKIPQRPLALGEHSGHMHVITGDVELFELDGRVFAAIGKDGARLQHVHESNFTPNAYRSMEELPVADHRSHLLPAGICEIWIQNEYNPFEKVFERVID